MYFKPAAETFRPSASRSATWPAISCSEPDALVSSIERILLGQVVFESKPRAGGSLAASLTPREHEVLTYIGRGLNTKEMAETMCLSPRTVERHVERLMQRLGVHERVKLALLAHREGLVGGSAPEPSA